MHSASGLRMETRDYDCSTLSVLVSVCPLNCVHSALFLLEDDIELADTCTHAYIYMQP